MTAFIVFRPGGMMLYFKDYILKSFEFIFFSSEFILIKIYLKSLLNYDKCLNNKFTYKESNINL